MNLKQIHLLLTYRCDMECDHCFVWGSPFSKGAMKLKDISTILHEAKKVGTIEGISIEGGEPFLFYPILLWTAREAVKLGFKVEILSNAYWATTEEDAVEWLKPISQLENIELTLSSDFYHGDSWKTEEAKNGIKAATKLGIPVSVLAIKYPFVTEECPKEFEGAKVGLYELMCKGRAYSKMTENLNKKPWTEFDKCPYEDLANPTRVHIDYLGFMHPCQGISIGNVLQQPLSQIINTYNPSAHPVIAPLLEGGPIALAKKYNLPHKENYADACHFCYDMRLNLRNKFPNILAPEQMYGEGLG